MDRKTGFDQRLESTRGKDIGKRPARKGEQEFACARGEDGVTEGDFDAAVLVFGEDALFTEAGNNAR